MPTRKLRVELHQHTCYSPDSPITYERLLKAYREGKFDVIAITDHDTIEGAVKFKEKGDFPVIIGEEITTLAIEKLASGKHSYEWDASNLASGVYLYRLQAGEYVETRKMVLMR